jgi:hypothetical protein
VHRSGGTDTGHDRKTEKHVMARPNASVARRSALPLGGGSCRCPALIVHIVSAGSRLGIDME